jgi:hypothetical protein
MRIQIKRTDIKYMEIPEEIRSHIVALSVLDSNIVFIWAHYPGIQYYIAKNKDLNWKSISRDQRLPECFIRAYKYQVDWDEIFIWQDLSRDFKKHFKNPVGDYSWKFDKNPIGFNWNEYYNYEK